MAFYDKFPYTNFQELNLDWLTQEVSKVRDNRDATDASAAAALASEQAAKASETAAAASQQAAASSQQAAANSETAAAGSEAASAEYLAQLGTHTAGAVADWLEENLKPTTPPVDESLTVSGAAADAKVTGDKVRALESDVAEDRTLNNIITKTAGVTSGLGTGPMANNRRWFMSDEIPAGAVIKDTNYFCASATSGTIDIELWEKSGDTLTRVLIVTQTPAASTWNHADLNYTAEKPVMISFKPSAGSLRSDSQAAGALTYGAVDLTSDTLSFSALSLFRNFQICANVNYVVKDIHKKLFVVDKNGNGDFTSFSQALITVYENHPNAEIIVNPGTYDIYQEMIDIYGSTYWNTISTSQADQRRNLFGLPFGNGMKIHGNPGAVVTINNISSNPIPKTWFAILHGEENSSSKYHGAECRNIVFDCKNIRYAVHLDFGAETISGEYVIDSCRMKLDNSGNDQRTNAYVIGMGGGAYTTYKLTNNYINPIFPENTRDNAGIFYHNSANEDAKNRCNIVNNFVANGGTIRADAYGTSQNKCLVMITGNSIGESILVNNSGDNLEVIAWNNIVRS